MSMKNKLNTVTKLTEKKEKAFIKELNKAYNNSYKEMKLLLTKQIAKLKTDVFTQEEMLKFNRLDNLVKNLEKELKVVEGLQTNQINTFLKDSYELNYYHTAYALETETQVKMGFSILDREQVAKAINNPLTNIALDDNKKAARQGIRRALTQSVVKGEGIQKTARGIAKQLEMSANRATRIVRTETTGIMGSARQDAMVQAGKKVKLKKQWEATLDDRTRDRHSEMNGEVVDIDKPFSNGLMYPGDQSGDAEQIVNCRCTMITIIPDVEIVDGPVSNKVSSDLNYNQWVKTRLKHG